MTNTFKIKSLTIDQSKSIINVTRSYKVLKSVESTSASILIPDEIDDFESVEIQDNVFNGSTILFPQKPIPMFPIDLHSNDQYKNEKFLLVLKNGNQIFGRFLYVKKLPTNATKLVFDVTESNSTNIEIKILNGPTTIDQDDIVLYFQVNEMDQFINECNVSYNTSNLTRLQFNSNEETREILVSYNLPLNSITYGKIVHCIKGIDSNSVLTNQELSSDISIPITITTEFFWKPKWDISKSDGVTFNLISNDGKQKYTINNFVCFKNYENKFIINQFNTTCNRSLLVYPLGPIQVVLYFKNTSSLLLSNSQIKFIDNKQSSVKTLGTTGEKYQLLKSVDPNSIGIITFTPSATSKLQIYKEIKHYPLSDLKSKEYNVKDIKFELQYQTLQQQHQMQQRIQQHQLQQQSYPSSSFSSSSSLSSNSLSSNSVSSSIEVMETAASHLVSSEIQTLNKIKYQFVNGTSKKTNFIVYFTNEQQNNQPPQIHQPSQPMKQSSYQTSNNINQQDVETPSTLGTNDNEPFYINESIEDDGDQDVCNFEKIGDSLYLFNETLPLSINNFQIVHNYTRKVTNNYKSSELVEFLKKIGIEIDETSKFQSFDVSNLQREQMDTLASLLNWTLESKSNEYFSKPMATLTPQTLFIDNGLFGHFDTPKYTVFRKRLTKTSSGSCPSSISSTPQPQLQQPSSVFSGLFGKSK